MKKLQSILEELSGDNKDADLNILINEAKEKVNTEQELYDRMEICKYIKINYNYQQNSVIYAQIGNFDREFFKYIESKVNFKNGKKQWNLMLDYINRVYDYFDISDDEVIFDTFEDYFLYLTMNPNIVNLKFKQGIEGWIFYKRAIAYRNLKHYNLAINDLYSGIKCSPMSFAIYEELFKCYLKIKDYNKLKECLNLSYKIAKTSNDLSVFYYYMAQYYYKTNNLQVAKACAVYATKFDINFIQKNQLIEMFNTIVNMDNLVTDVFVARTEEVLKKHNIPIWYSQEMMLATILCYKTCVTKVIDNNMLKNLSRKRLITYRLNGYIEQIDTNEYTDQNMVLYENYEFSVKLSKKWKIIYKVDNNSLEQGTILDAINGDDTLTIVMDKNINGLDFETIFNENIKDLNEHKINTEVLHEVTTITKKIIKRVIVNKDDKSVVMNFFMFNNKMFIISASKMDYEKEIYKIINSFKTFLSINHQLC